MSLGLNSALMMAAKSLATQQMAINVTSNNIANANTLGAARQRAIIAADLAINTGVGLLGTGAYVTDIEAIRSSLLDTQVVTQASVTGFYDKLVQLSSLIESMVGESLGTASSASTSSTSTTSETGLGAALSTFWDSWQALGDDPTSGTLRDAVLTQANNVAAMFNTIYSNLGDIKGAVIKEAQSNTDQVNLLASQIASLNQQIVWTESSTGATSNDLRDQRQVLVEQMASLVNVRVTQNATNSNMIDVSLAGDVSGRRLVSGVDGAGAGTSYRLNAVAVNPTTGNAEAAASYNTSTNSGLVYTLTTGTTAPAYSVRTNPPNGGGAIPAADLLAASATIEGELGAEYATINNILGNGTGTSSTTLIGQLYQLAQNLAAQVNSLQNSATSWDLNGNNNAGNLLAVSGTPPTMLTVVLTNSDSIAAASGTPFPGNLDGSNALNMASLRTNTSIGDYYNRIVTNLGTTVSQASSNQATQALIQSQVASQRDSVSGISIDDEMTNLMTFQRSYQASAKVLTTVDEMYQSILSMKQ